VRSVAGGPGASTAETIVASMLKAMGEHSDNPVFPSVI